MKRSECTPKKLREIGFTEIECGQEPNIKDIAYYLQIGFYDAKTEIDETKTYYRDGYEGDTPYYTHYTKHYYHPEYMLVRCHDRKFGDDWTRVLVRDVEFKTYVSNYTGD